MSAIRLEANDDAVTLQVHQARNTAFAALNKNGHTVIDRFGTNATSAGLLSAWASIPGNVTLVTALGHGDETTFTGHQQAMVLSTGAAHAAVKQAIVHLFSCHTAQQLGAKLVQDGAKGFIGYQDYVQIPDDANLTKHFVREAAAIDEAVLAGKNTAAVKAAGEAAYQKAHSDLSADPNTASEFLAALEFNHAALVGPWTNAKWGTV